MPSVKITSRLKRMTAATFTHHPYGIIAFKKHVVADSLIDQNVIYY